MTNVDVKASDKLDGDMLSGYQNTFHFSKSKYIEKTNLAKASIFYKNEMKDVTNEKSKQWERNSEEKAEWKIKLRNGMTKMRKNREKQRQNNEIKDISFAN